MGKPEHGRIAAGAAASFVVLNSNPLDDITNTRDIDAVILRGNVIDGERLACLRNRTCE